MTFPLPGANWTYLHVPRLQATTGISGFGLQDATPTLLQWTAPADGQLHRVTAIVDYLVTSAATGGQLSLQFTDPAGNFQSREFVAGGGGDGFATVFGPPCYLVQPGSTVYLVQAALTAGAATVWAELWGS
jgi:hypothetical protein